MTLTFLTLYELGGGENKQQAECRNFCSWCSILVVIYPWPSMGYKLNRSKTSSLLTKECNIVHLCKKKLSWMISKTKKIFRYWNEMCIEESCWLIWLDQVPSSIFFNSLFLKEIGSKLIWRLHFSVIHHTQMLEYRLGFAM